MESDELEKMVVSLAEVKAQKSILLHSRMMPILQYIVAGKVPNDTQEARAMRK